MDAVSALLALPGGWPVAGVMLAGVGVLFLRGDIVARFVYNREIRRGDKLEFQLDRNTEALGALTNEIRFGGRRA